MKESNRRLALASLLVAAFAIASPAQAGFLGFGADVPRPPASEFGFGPRASANRLYTATLQPREALRLRQLQSVTVQVVDASGRPVDDAAIAIDGGMPEHSHGLPTQPRVKRAAGPGLYEIEGVRFSMGGWWELKLAIESPAGTDHVTFNLGL